MSSIYMNRTTETVNPYDGLILGAPVSTFEIKIRELAATTADTVFKRGTLLDLSSVDGKYVVHGTSPAAAVEAVSAVYTKTSDVALTTGKTYYTKAGDVYTKVTTPDVSDIGDYYELTTPASPAVPAEVLTANCILCDDIIVTDNADVLALAYRNIGSASATYISAATAETKGNTVTITAADKEALRVVGINLNDTYAAY